MSGTINTKSVVFAINPIIGTIIYSIGDQIGVPFAIGNTFTQGTSQVSPTLSCGGTALLQTVKLVDTDSSGSESPAIDFLLFDRKPTVTSSDNDAFSITDAEMHYCVGHVHIASADYSLYSSFGIATLNNIGLLVQLYKNSNQLWCVMVAQSAVTFASASDLTLKFGFLVD